MCWCLQNCTLFLGRTVRDRKRVVRDSPENEKKTVIGQTVVREVATPQKRKRHNNLCFMKKKIRNNPPSGETQPFSFELYYLLKYTHMQTTLEEICFEYIRRLSLWSFQVEAGNQLQILF